MDEKKIHKYALLGFGGLGRVHFKNLLQIEKERGDISLAAICGADKSSLQKKSEINIGSTDLSDVDFSEYNFYDTADELLENEELSFVVSALPTVLHAEMAIKAMERGISVFSEKPMALSLEDCEKMVHCAEENKVQLMIGQCLRFDPKLQRVKKMIDDKEYGNVLRAEFTRYSQVPKWTHNNWILDIKQSGGCILDMHCHDVDIINYFFGMPQAVSSVVTNNKVELESAFTRYIYPDKIVTANADWSLPQKFPFCAHSMFVFDSAVAEIKDDVLKVYTDDEVIVPEVSSEDFYMCEMREFVSCAVSGEESSISTGNSVKNSVKIAMAELESAKKNSIERIG